MVLGDHELRRGWWSVDARGLRFGWSTYGMAAAQGVDVEEGQGLVTLEELEAGDFSCDGRGSVLAMSW